MITDKDRLAAARVAIARYTPGVGGGSSIDTIPTDWPSITTDADNTIRLLVCDGGLAQCSFMVATTLDDYIVDWGDGTSDNCISGEFAMHTYVKGTGIACSRGYTTFIASITSSSPIIAMAVNDAPGLLACYINASSLTMLDSFVGNCSALESVISAVPLTNVASAMAAFGYCSNLHVVDLPGLSSLINAYGMFVDCVRLKNIDVSSMVNVQNAGSMFSACSSLEQLDISMLTSLTDISAIVAYCYSLRCIQLPTILAADAWSIFSNTQLGPEYLAALHACSDISSAFYRASGIFSAHISGFAANNIRSIFQYSHSIAYAYIENMPNLTDCSYALADCPSLIEAHIDLPNITSGNSLFYDSNRLTNVQLHSTNNITDAEDMFYGCNTLVTLDTSHFRKVTNAEGMFSRCYSLKQIDMTNFVSVTNADNMFFATAIESIDSSGFGSVTNAREMFCGCHDLKGELCDLTGLTSVTDAYEMFYGCNFTSIDLTGLSSVSNAYAMFTYCYDLISVDATKLGFLTDIRQMFNQCWHLQYVKFDMSKMQNNRSTSGLFSGVGSWYNSDTGQYETSELTVECINCTTANTTNILGATGVVHGIASSPSTQVGDVYAIGNATLKTLTIDVPSALLISIQNNPVLSSVSIANTMLQHGMYIINNAILASLNLGTVTLYDPNVTGTDNYYIWLNNNASLATISINLVILQASYSIQLAIFNNKLSSAALDSLFASLPSVSAYSCNVIYGGNPGTSTCNPNIAASKGWIMQLS